MLACLIIAKVMVLGVQVAKAHKDREELFTILAHLDEVPPASHQDAHVEVVIGEIRFKFTTSEWAEIQGKAPRDAAPYFRTARDRAAT